MAAAQTDLRRSALPRFSSEELVPSSGHELFRGRELQLLSRIHPFNATTVNQEVYKRWDLPPKPTPASQPTRVSVPFTGKTTYADTFLQHPIERQPREAKVFARSVIPFSGTTAYQDCFVPHKIDPQPPPLPMPPRPIHVKLEDKTTNKETYVAHPICPRKVEPVLYQHQPGRFDGISEAHATYTAHPIGSRPPPPPLPPRIVVPFAGTTTNHEAYVGWQLPQRRGALGVAMLADQFHALIPPNARLPASATQVFTTAHDGQTEVSILLYQGDSAIASKNALLGQFQLVGLPPARKGDLKIEVKFNVSADNVLSVEAREQASGAKHLWQRQQTSCQ